MQLQLFPFFYESFHKYLGSLLFQSIPDNLLKYNISSLEQIQNASIFADRVKFTKQYAFTRTWHYLDIPQTLCDNNQTIVFDYLVSKNNTGLLKGLFNGTKTRQFEFTLHFLQDLIQPFHTIDYFKGGNSIYLQVDKKNISLHAFWDSTLPKLYKPINNLKCNNGINNVYTSILNQLYKGFKRACSFRLSNNTIINSKEYFDSNNLQHLFQDMIQEYLDLAFLFFK